MSSTPLKNQRHELFAQAVAKGVSGPDAYLGAGYDVSSAVASACASRLLNDAKIQQRIAELQGKAGEIAVKSLALDREWVLSRMMRNAEICMGNEKVTAVRAVKSRIKDESGGYQDVVATVEITVTERDATAANRALELLGREYGMFVEKKEIGAPGDFSDHTDAELAERFADLARQVGGGGEDSRGIEAASDKARVRGKPSSVH